MLTSIREIVVASLLGLAVLLLGATCPAQAKPVGAASTAGQEPPSTPPNIIIILVDDMGFSDLGCTGAEIETPNIDALAKHGVLFTNCYNTSRCCPSRASLLTGQYQWDAGLGHMTSTKSNLPEYQRELSSKTPTIAEILQTAGYQTFMAGKWHLGDKRDAWPDRRGFDHFYGTPTGGGLYFYPSQFYKRPVFRDGVKVHPDADWYSTDGFTDACVEFIRNKRSENNPFLMYLAYIAPHFPLQAKAKDIQKYRDTYHVGYEAIRLARHTRQRTLGIATNDFPPSEPTHGDWHAVANQAAEARKMAVYAAQIDCVDQNIGKLRAALDDEKIAENTVILFLSDNGACSRRFNRTPNAEIGSRSCNAAYGDWHNVSNTPYRRAKSQVHEGGIITPMIVNWPEGIAKPGHIIKVPVHIMDIAPSLLELSDVKYPATERISVATQIDGKSFLPLLDGAPQEPSREFYWEHEGNRAVRRGDWKLVALHKGPWELYDLSQDPYEEHDLATQRPKMVADLRSLYSQWTKRHSVQPWPLKQSGRLRKKSS